MVSMKVRISKTIRTTLLKKIRRKLCRKTLPTKQASEKSGILLPTERPSETSGRLLLTYILIDKLPMNEIGWKLATSVSVGNY